MITDRGEAERNPFKTALREHRRQIGLWSSLCSNIVAEVLSDAGFSWIVLDAEHSPNELAGILQQLQAMRAGTAEPVVRPPANDPILIKRLLDIGVRSFLIPQVRGAAEVEQTIRATRYPPHGGRGISVAQRANRYGRVKDYLRQADDGICLLIQIETEEAIGEVDAIAGLDGVDGLFVGPSDLAASLGHPGDARHEAVQRAFDDVLAAARRAGKPAGILAPVEADAAGYIGRGFSFVAVGSDLGLLVNGCAALIKRFGNGVRP